MAREVTKLTFSQIVLERRTKESDSLVGEKCKSSWLGVPSTMEHVEFCGNLSRPLDKAKYLPVTDSELVLRRKGEKNPWRGVK